MNLNIVREIAFNIIWGQPLFFYIQELTPSLAKLGISPLSRERGGVPQVRRGEYLKNSNSFLSIIPAHFLKAISLSIS